MRPGARTGALSAAKATALVGLAHGSHIRSTSILLLFVDADSRSVAFRMRKPDWYAFVRGR